MSALQTVFDAFGTLAGAVIVACAPVITYKVTQWLGVKMDTDQRNSLNAAIQTGLGKALQVGQAAGDAKLANVTIKNAGVAAAVAYVAANAPDAVAHFGLTDASIAEKASAKLATLLHETGAAPASSPSQAAATGAMLDKVQAAEAVPVPPTVATAMSAPILDAGKLTTT